MHIITRKRLNAFAAKYPAMLARELKQVEHAWPAIKEAVFYPHTEAEYDRLVTVLDALIDEVGESEHHPLASLMEVIGILIETYEDTDRARCCPPTLLLHLRSMVSKQTHWQHQSS